MKVKDIMTKDLVVADKDDTVLDIAKLMKHHNIGCVPVLDHGEKVLGVITDRDIVMNMAKFNLDPTNTFAGEIASDVVYKVKPEADVEDALALMKKQRIRRLPVIEDDALVGMLSIGDVAVHAFKNVEVGEALLEISRPARVENIWKLGS